MIEVLYQTKLSVFTFKDIALLLKESNVNALKSKINYYVQVHKIKQVRKGIYCLPDFDTEELACKLYAPTYISLEYVLQKEGVIFQYQESITSLCSLSRTVVMDEKTYVYRKIKNEILFNMIGVNRTENKSIASKERAILDTLYMNKDFHFDNLRNLDKDLIKELLMKVYCNQALTQRAKRILNV